MRRALKDRLAAYKVPQEMKVVEELPKNAMGKGKPATLMIVLLLSQDDDDADMPALVNKKSLIRDIFGSEA